MTSVLIVLTTACCMLFGLGCGQQKTVEMFPKEGETVAATNEVVAVSATPVTARPTAQATATVVSSTPAATPGSSLQAQPSPLPTDPMERTKMIQIALKNLNLYTGSIDGRIGPLTEEAIKSFQSSHNLKADGKVGPLTWAELSKYVSSPSGSSSEGTQQ